MEIGPCSAITSLTIDKSNSYKNVTGIRRAPWPGLLPGIFLQ